MVRTRLRRLTWLLGLMPLLAHAAGAVGTLRGLELVLERDETELGLAVAAELRAIGSESGLSQIDLEPLQRDFGVRVEEYRTRTESSPAGPESVEILKLALYPRHIGTLTVPALKFGGTRTRARSIAVTTPAVQGRPIDVSTRVEPAQAWERQSILILVEVSTPERFASLETDRLKAPSFEVVVVPPTREWVGEGNARAAVLRAGWILFPLAAGDHRVDLPPLRYRSGGRDQRVFYLPRQPLRVRALPPYVPPLLPVGEVSITSTVEPASLLNTDTLAYWTVTLRGTQLTPYQLPAIRRQLQDHPGIEILPIESSRRSRPDPDGVHGEVIHRIPFKATSSGSLPLPPLKIQYFNPGSRRVVTHTHRADGPFVLGPVWRVLITGVALISSLVGARAGVRHWRRARQRQRQRRQALAQIDRAKDAHGLRAALRPAARAEAWSPNLSIGEWASHWQARYQTGPEFGDTIAELSHACYGARAPETIEPLRERLRTHLLARTRRRRRARGTPGDPSRHPMESVP